MKDRDSFLDVVCCRYESPRGVHSYNSILKFSRNGFHNVSRLLCLSGVVAARADTIMASLGGWRRGPDGRPIHVPLDDLCSQVEAAMRDPAVSFVSLSGLAIDPNTVKALFTKLKTQAAQGRRGDLYLDLADNRMAPANREDFHHILQCLESMPWLRVRLGYDISRNYLTESMANFEPSTQQRVEVASPWQEATLSAAVQELKNAVAKMDHRTEAALKALSGSTAKLKENGKMHSNAIEADVAEAIRRWLVNGKIVCIGYNFQIDEDAWCGDVDAVVAGTAPEGCNAAGKEVVIICEAKSNVKKKDASGGPPGFPKRTAMD
mmetsp:Transcript_34359/g.86587  ORF Transcript_34359/g.86587 Transcript_34359/m.86587 type:complete len:321 (-) Transcript_34359:669-1631(-)